MPPGGSGNLNLNLNVNAASVVPAIQQLTNAVNTLGSAFQRAFQPAASAASAAQQAMTRTSSAAAALARSVSSVASNMGSFLRVMRDAVLTTSALTRLFLDFGSIISGTVLRGITVLAGAFKLIKSTVLDATERFVKFQTQLEGMTKSFERARQIAGFVQEFARSTPFKTEELEQIVRVLGQIPATAGLLRQADFSKVKKDLEGLVNTIQGLAILNPQGIEGALIAFRNAAAGQLRSIELRLDIPAQAIAEASGKTVAELKKGGKVVLKALEDYVNLVLGADSIKKLSRTLTVQLGNISDAFAIIGRQIGQSGFYEQVVRFFTGVSESIGDFVRIAKDGISEFERLGFAQRISDALSSSFTSITGSLKVAGSALFGLAGKESASTFNASPIQAFAAAVSSALELIAVGLKKGSAALNAFFGQIDSGGKTGFQRLADFFITAGKKLGSALVDFAQALSGLAPLLKIMVPILKIALESLVSIARLVATLLPALQSGFTKASEASTGIGAVTGFFSGFFETFAERGKEQFQNIFDSFESNLEELAAVASGGSQSEVIGARISRLNQEIASKTAVAAAAAQPRAGSQEEFLQTFSGVKPTSSLEIASITAERDRLQKRLSEVEASQQSGTAAGLLTILAGVSKSTSLVSPTLPNPSNAARVELDRAASFQIQELEQSSRALSDLHEVSSRLSDSFEGNLAIFQKIEGTELPDVVKARGLAAAGTSRLDASIANNFGVTPRTGGLDVSQFSFGLGTSAIPPELLVGAGAKRFALGAQLGNIERASTRRNQLALFQGSELLSGGKEQAQGFLPLVREVLGRGTNFRDVQAGEKETAQFGAQFFEAVLDESALRVASKKLNDSTETTADRLSAAADRQNIYQRALDETGRALGFGTSELEQFQSAGKNYATLTAEQKKQYQDLVPVAAAFVQAQGRARDALEETSQVVDQLIPKSGRVAADRLGIATQGSVEDQLRGIETNLSVLQRSGEPINQFQLERNVLPKLEELREITFDPTQLQRIDALIAVADSGIIVELSDATKNFLGGVEGGFQSSLSEGIDLALQGDHKKGLEAFTEGLAESIRKSLADTLADVITDAVFSPIKTAFGDLFKTLGGGSALSTATITASTVYVNGGVAGAAGTAGTAGGTTPIVASGGYPGFPGAVGSTTTASQGAGGGAPLLLTGGGTSAAAPSSAAQAAAVSSGGGAGGVPLILGTGTGATGASGVGTGSIITQPSSGNTQGILMDATAQPAAGAAPAGAGLEGVLPYLGGALGTVNGIRGLTQEGGTKGTRGIGNIISALALPLALTPLGPVAGIIAALAGGTISSFGDGGDVYEPTLAVVGEKGPERIMPHSKMRGGMNPSTARHIAGGHGGPRTSSDPDFEEPGRPGSGNRAKDNITIVNTIDPDRITRESLERDPNTVVNAVVADINGGGRIARAMKNRR